jgi:ethanolamine-phosphate cytidylyltransferase
LSPGSGGYGGVSTLEAQETVNALIAKYDMSSEDAAALRRVVGAPSSLELPSAALGTPTPEKVRTKAPVHLLTSTRRVMEFSSSREPGHRDRVVYVRGSFDMFHVGHAQFLKDARALGSFLLVGIQEDSVVRQAKGANFPIMSLTERILNVCACKWVDEVIIGAPLIVTEDLIKTWDIKVVAMGTGYKKCRHSDSTSDPFLVPRQANICTEVPSQWPELCHDTIVQRIMDSRQVYMKRNADRATREDVYYDQKSKGELPS